MTESMAFSALIQKRYLKVVMALGYVLTLGTQDAWWDFVTLLMVHLKVEERTTLASKVLESLDRHDAIMAADEALSAGAGQPQAPLFDFTDQAAFWADLAEPEELEDYGLAIFNALPCDRRVALLNYLQKREVA